MRSLFIRWNLLFCDDGGFIRDGLLLHASYHFSPWEQNIWTDTRVVLMLSSGGKYIETTRAALPFKEIVLTSVALHGMFILRTIQAHKWYDLETHQYAMSKKVTPKGTGVTREKNTFILKSVCHAAVASEIILPVLWSFLVVQSAVLVATLSPRRRGLHVKKNDSRQTTFIGIFIFRNASV